MANQMSQITKQATNGEQIQFWYYLIALFIMPSADFEL